MGGPDNHIHNVNKPQCLRCGEWGQVGGVVREGCGWLGCFKTQTEGFCKFLELELDTIVTK